MAHTADREGIILGIDQKVTILDADILFKLYLKSSTRKSRKGLNTKAPSLGKLAAWLLEHGIINCKTGLPYTREGLRQTLLKNPDYIKMAATQFKGRKHNQNRIKELLDNA